MIRRDLREDCDQSRFGELPSYLELCWRLKEDWELENGEKKYI